MHGLIEGGSGSWDYMNAGTPYSSCLDSGYLDVPGLDCEVGGNIIRIDHNTVTSVSNNHRPMDYAQPQRGSRDGGLGNGISSVYLRGIPLGEARVDSNNFADSCGYRSPGCSPGALRQVFVRGDEGYRRTPVNFFENDNRFNRGWSQSNSSRRFFERFGDVFQEKGETTIPDDGHFALEDWPYQWSAHSRSRLSHHTMGYYGLEDNYLLRTWKVESGKATTRRHDILNPILNPIGEMRSKRFQINKNYVSFRIAGYMDKQSDGTCGNPNPKYANQVAMLRAHDDAVIFKKNVPCQEPFVLYNHDLSSYNDDDNNNDTWAYFVLSDGDWNGGGWIEVDDIYFFDGAPAKPDDLSAEVDYEGVSSFDDIRLNYRLPNPWDDIVILSWDDPNNPSIRTWKYQWRESGSAWDENNQQSISWNNVNYTTEDGQARIVARVRAPINPPMATTYEYRVRGINGAELGAGDVSASVPVEILAFPGSPENLVAMAGDESVTLRWEAPTSDGGSAITGYTYRYRTGDSEPWMPSADGVTLHETTSYVRDTIDDLINGTTYTFEVRAHTTRGVGPASMVEVTLNSAPMISGFGTPSFDENGTGTVTSYTATDVEGDAIEWSLSGRDAGAFTFTPDHIDPNTIVLSFPSAPDYEHPVDLPPTDNVYEVTVVAEDDGTPRLSTEYQAEVRGSECGRGRHRRAVAAGAASRGTVDGGADRPRWGYHGGRVAVAGTGAG